MTIRDAYQGLYAFALVFLSAMILLCFVRAVRGPRITDRIVAINMISTMVIIIIGILALMLGEGYLVDVALIYAMISFLAVVVLCKVYMGVYQERKEKQGGGGDGA